MYEVKVVADASVQFLFWEEDEGRDLPVELRDADNLDITSWYVMFNSDIIYGIGLRCKDFTILKSFSARKLEDEEVAAKAVDVTVFKL